MGVDNTEISSITDSLFSAILLEQQKINAIKPADSHKKAQSDSLLKEYAALRGRDFCILIFLLGEAMAPFLS